MDGQPLRIPLVVLDILLPHRGGVINAHVMFIGPVESEENMKLRAVCGACLILLSSGRYSDFLSFLFLSISQNLDPDFPP